MTTQTETGKRRFYYAFGIGYNLARNYIVVEAEDRETARRAFQAERAKVDNYGGRLYAFDYDEDGFAGQIEQYGLTEVPIDAPIWER